MNAVKACDKYYSLLPVLYGEQNKGWGFSEDISQAISSFYAYVKGFNASYCVKIYNKCRVAEQLMLNIRGVKPATDVIHSVYRQLGKPTPPHLDESLCKTAINLSVVDLFFDSDPAKECNKGKGEPLGLLAES